jgi:hypothetical protein
MATKTYTQDRIDPNDLAALGDAYLNDLAALGDAYLDDLDLGSAYDSAPTIEPADPTEGSYEWWERTL